MKTYNVTLFKDRSMEWLLGLRTLRTKDIIPYKVKKVVKKKDDNVIEKFLKMMTAEQRLAFEAGKREAEKQKKGFINDGLRETSQDN
jgi:hypothetical protein